MTLIIRAIQLYFQFHFHKPKRNATEVTCFLVVLFYAYLARHDYFIMLQLYLRVQQTEIWIILINFDNVMIQRLHKSSDLNSQSTYNLQETWEHSNHLSTVLSTSTVKVSCSKRVTLKVGTRKWEMRNGKWGNEEMRKWGNGLPVRAKSTL